MWSGMEGRYTSVHHHYATKMSRVGVAAGVVSNNLPSSCRVIIPGPQVWGVASLCLAILAGLVLVSDQWLGDTPASPAPGNFGLWRWCSDRRTDGIHTCRGDLTR